MHRTALLALVIASFLPATTSSAQTRHVAISDLTVEQRDPPASLMQRLQDETVGVMGGLTGCYAQRLAARADLAGEWRLRLWVSAQQVIRVTPEGGTFEDPDLLVCVKQRLLEFRLPPDAPRAGANVRFRLSFTSPASGNTLACASSRCAEVACGALEQACCPGSACGPGAECREALCRAPLPPPPPPPPPIRVEVARARGGMTVSEVATAFPSSTFASCASGSTGDVVMSVTITRAGRVRATRTSGSLSDRTARTCIRDAMVALALEARSRTTYARVVVDLDPPR